MKPTQAHSRTLRTSLNNALSQNQFSKLHFSTIIGLATFKMTTNRASGLKRSHSGSGGLSPPPVKRQQLSTITRMWLDFTRDGNVIDLTEEKAVTNFFKPASQKQKDPEKVTWRIINDGLLIGKYQGSQLVARKENEHRQRIAGFDFVCNAGSWPPATIGPGQIL